MDLTHFLPPLFSTNPHLRVIEVGTINSEPFVKFINTGPGRLREVVIVIIRAGKQQGFRYDYSMVSDDGVIEIYSGPHGDPAKDTATPWGVLNPKSGT